MERSTTLCCGLALFASFGCSSTSDAASDATPVQCEALDYRGNAEPITIAQVQAEFRLPSGEAAANLPVQVCGINLCLNYTASGSGALNVAPRSSMVLPALKYGDGFDFAELAVPLSDPKPDLGELVAVPLPAFSEGSQFPKSGALTNGDLTLDLDSRGSFEHDILTYRDDELVFRSVAIPVGESPQALDPSLRFEVAYGVAPLGTTFCPPAKISLKNTGNWDPGTVVEVFVQGLDVAEKWAPYGQWVQVAEANVSSDGRRIETTSGGIPILSSIALRRK